MDANRRGREKKMQSKTAKLIPAKNKIESVTVRRIVDESPDTSYYGEYSDTRASEFSIDRAHMGRHEYRYFNPSLNYVDGSGELREGNTAEEVRKYVAQDYARMEDLNQGRWCFVGVKAEAEISIPSGSGYSTLQKIHSGGVWGFESDSSAAYFAEVIKDELADLRGQLKALGFSSGRLRWLSAEKKAFQNVQEQSE